MEEFTRQFGIDWRLLLSQMVNFAIVLFVLQRFVYKPVARMLAERKLHIEEGIAKASEADKRLEEAQLVLKQKRKEAEDKALAFMRKAEEEAKAEQVILQEVARKKHVLAMKEAEKAIEGEKEKARQNLYTEAANLVRDAIVKTVELDPEKIDEALIQKALSRVEK